MWICDNIAKLRQAGAWLLLSLAIEVFKKFEFFEKFKVLKKFEFLKKFKILKKFEGLILKF